MWNVISCVSNQEFVEYREKRGKMLLSRRNQLLLEFSFWNEPVPRAGPNIYELRSYQLRVWGWSFRDPRRSTFQRTLVHWSYIWLDFTWCAFSLLAWNDDRVGELLVRKWNDTGCVSFMLFTVTYTREMELSQLLLILPLQLLRFETAG